MFPKYKGEDKMQNRTIFQKLSDIREKCRSLSSQEDIFKDGIIKIKIEDLDWLIEQAEKAEKQQEIIKVNYAEYGQLQEKYKKAKEEIEFLKDELQQTQEELGRWESGLNVHSKYYGLETKLQQAQTKLNSIRFYVENPVPDDKLTEIILNIINDPNHDGI
jgi:predicted nuclease with TOPRIM domain